MKATPTSDRSFQSANRSISFGSEIREEIERLTNGKLALKLKDSRVEGGYDPDYHVLSEGKHIATLDPTYSNYFKGELARKSSTRVLSSSAWKRNRLI